MRSSLVTSVVLAVMMASSAAVTRVVTPTVKMADAQGKLDLERMIPQQFGDWRVDTSIVPLQIDPETQAKLDVLYNQTLARTYINGAGERMMLSIAYGGNQDDNTGLHRPEVCYAAQGFDLQRNVTGRLATAYGVLPVRRLLAVSGNRSEPITYWITVGGHAIESGIAQKVQQLRYGLSGKVPDGMLVRVSTISGELDGAYRGEDQFIHAMLGALDDKSRVRLTGSFVE